MTWKNSDTYSILVSVYKSSAVHSLCVVYQSGISQKFWDIPPPWTSVVGGAIL